MVDISKIVQQFFHFVIALFHHRALFHSTKARYHYAIALIHCYSIALFSSIALFHSALARFHYTELLLIIHLSLILAVCATFLAQPSNESFHI